MALGRTTSVALRGIEGTVVEVETDISSGLPAFLISGLPDAACRQSADRIRAACANSALDLPRSRCTVNLSPASVPKSGSGFDLPIAIALLVAAQKVSQRVVGDVVHLGELGLDGALRPVRGILPSVLAARRAGHRRVVVPIDNAVEARLVEGMEVVGAESLGEVVARHLATSRDQEWLTPEATAEVAVTSPPPPRDLRDVVGQSDARFALELAAAGGHHVFLVGPPGAGKTLLAESLPSILPPLGAEEALDVTAIHSVMGALPPGALVTVPPFVAPHHGASTAALVGGGSGTVRPGLISQAHRGVLFLDEAPHFRSTALQSLRQPLESGVINVVRSGSHASFPARFLLVLAANPCPCGRGHGKGLHCVCSPRDRRTYLAPLSGPLLDRVDVQLDVHPVPRSQLVGPGGEPSSAVLARVLAARARAAERLRGTPWRLNSEVPGSALRDRWRLSHSATADADRALDRGQLTLRGYDRVLRLAWTVADLTGAERPGRAELGQALTLRLTTAVAA